MYYALCETWRNLSVHFGDRSKDLWSLPFEKLADECHVIAEDTSGKIDAAHHLEARILSASWKEAMALPDHDPVTHYEAGARKASALAGLRQRTIEVIVKIWGKLPDADSEPGDGLPNHEYE